MAVLIVAVRAVWARLRQDYLKAAATAASELYGTGADTKPTTVNRSPLAAYSQVIPDAAPARPIVGVGASGTSPLRLILVSRIQLCATTCHLRIGTGIGTRHRRTTMPRYRLSWS